MAVERQQQVVALLQSQRVEPAGLYQPVAVVAYVVDEDVAHVVDVFGDHAFLVQVAVGHHAGGEQVVGDGVDDGAVHLARHVHVERAGSGDDVCHLQSALFGYDGAAHGGCQVVDHEYHLCGVGIEFFFEGQHDGGCRFRLSLRAYAQAGVGLPHVEVGEERGFQAVVGFGACIYYAVGNVLSAFPCRVDGTADGRYLHEVGTCARYDCYFHYLSQDEK